MDEIARLTSGRRAVIVISGVSMDGSNVWLKAADTRPLFPPWTVVRFTRNTVLIVGSQHILLHGMTGTVIRYDYWSDCFEVVLKTPPHHITWASEYEIEKI